mgnify:CR=1 FL=1
MMNSVCLLNGDTALYDDIYGGGASTNPTKPPSPENANLVAAPDGGELSSGNFEKLSPVFL